MLIDRWFHLKITMSKLTIHIPKQFLEDSNDYVMECNEVLGLLWIDTKLLIMKRIEFNQANYSIDLNLKQILKCCQVNLKMIC